MYIYSPAQMISFAVHSNPFQYMNRNLYFKEILLMVIVISKDYYLAGTQVNTLDVQTIQFKLYLENDLNSLYIDNL